MTMSKLEEIETKIYELLNDKTLSQKELVYELVSLIIKVKSETIEDVKENIIKQIKGES